MRALVVEDDVLVRHLIGRVITSRGHEVVAVSTATEALEQHLRNPFPLMLVDWMLPGIDGLELCRRVRQGQRGDDVVILLVTARDKPEERDRAMAAGASDYLAKPIDPGTLQTRLVVAERAVSAAQRRREAVEALGDSEARLRGIFSAAVDGIVTYDDYGRIESLNPAALTLFGLDEDRAVGRPISELIPRSEEHEISRPWEQHARALPRAPSELMAKAADGRLFPVEVSMSSAEIAGRTLVTLIVRDLTERKEIESKLLLADRMATVGTLAAGIAHEINNPLAYVVANLGVVAEDLETLHGLADDELMKRCVESLAEAQEGAERVRDIVRDLKTFSRPDDRKLGPVDVHAVLESALSMAAKEIRHRARVVRDFEQGLGPAYVNEARIGQVFLNLLVNAAQAISGQQPVVDEIRVITRSVSQGAGILVEVADTGSGIPADVLPRIFDPFFTTKPVGVGTGLGLSICHGIVTQLGGEIAVESELGRGTAVRVTLPAAEQEPWVAEPTPEPLPAPGRAHILVIDDERFVARALGRALRDHDVVAVPSGVAALEMLAQRQFDLVFCDLIMPELSGMDVFAEVRRRHPGMAAKFVFMTGGAYTREAQAFLADTENRWIEKPFGAAQLKQVVRDELLRARADAG